MEVPEHLRTKSLDDSTIDSFRKDAEKNYQELLKKQKAFEIRQANRLLNARRRMNIALESNENTVAIINLVQAVDCMLHFIEDSIKAGHNGYVEE